MAAAVSALTGPIQQIPSSVSAIKVNGVRSYARVRAGEDVTLKARAVVVNRFEVLARREDSADGVPVVDLDVLVDCTTGTYVRALARDLGAALGVGGHLTALRRSRVGPFTLGGRPDPRSRRHRPRPDRPARGGPALLRHDHRG